MGYKGNGAGKPDYIFDYAQMECGTLYCGSAGCALSIKMSTGAGHRDAVDDNVRAWSIKRAGNRDVLVLDLHGSACSRTGAALCSRTFVWNGSRFVPSR